MRDQVFIPTQKCKCHRCSQGFCHWCEPKESVVVAIVPQVSYEYHSGCGPVRLPRNPGETFIVEAAGCEYHKKAGAR